MVNTMKQIIDRAAEILKSGGVIAYPTDTVYGLGAIYDDIGAIERIYAIKKRLNLKALPLIVSSENQLLEVVECIPETARVLTDTFWPGALTLVFKRSATVPDIVTGGRDTVAVRMPDHPAALLLAKKAGKAICGTSANVSGSNSAISAAEVKLQLRHTVDYIVDIGPEPLGIESTILDISQEPFRVLREGAVSVEKLNQYLNLKGVF